MLQPTFFDKGAGDDGPDPEQLVLYALGDFQARGKHLAERELPLDRLRGALRRAAERFGAPVLNDELAVAAFESLGANVRRVPAFFAKHPFRITVSHDLAARARDFFEKSS